MIGKGEVSRSRMMLMVQKLGGKRLAHLPAPGEDLTEKGLGARSVHRRT